LGTFAGLFERKGIIVVVPLISSARSIQFMSFVKRKKGKGERESTYGMRSLDKFSRQKGVPTPKKKKRKKKTG